MWRILPMLIAGVVSAGDLKRDGQLGFPQKSATVICDTGELRLSVVADTTYVYFQAVMWGDHENEEGSERGRPSSDNCTFCLDLDGDGQPTRGVDRIYHLNTSDGTMPISCSESRGGNNWTAAKASTKARGKIAFFDVDGKKVRVDSIAIPLDELKIKPNTTVNVLFYGRSFKPDKRYMSIQLDTDRAVDYWQVPWEKFSSYRLGAVAMGLDVSQLPTAN